MTASTNTMTSTLPLLPVERAGPLAGMRNLLRKELSEWWRTRLWWTQMLIWVALLNGVTTVVMLTEPTLAGSDLLRDVTSTFLQMAGIAIGIGVVLTVQGSIVGEKELGTAAWVMSKPASRTAFVLAKLIGHAVGFVVTAITVPVAVFWIEATILLPATPAVGPFTVGVGVVMLGIGFYIALALALGTLSTGRGPVAGIGIGVVLAGVFFKEMLPPVIVLAMPWLLGDIAGAIATGGPLVGGWPVPIVTTAVAACAFTLVAVWRFGREEF